MFLTGLSDDPDVPFTVDRAVSLEQAAPGASGPVVRKVDTGATVFDITGMIAELESSPDARKRT